jgi:hypothetical protein
MGKGTDLARSAGGGLHADVIDDLKDQLVICFLKRLVDAEGRFSIPVAEVDATGSSVVLLSVSDGAFNFKVEAKQ